MVVSREQLQELYPRASKTVIDALAEQNGAVFERFGISALLNRLQYFLAQIGHESGGGTIGEENLNYSPARLMQVWPGRFPNLIVAEQYAHDPEKLGDYVYANRMGNGPPASGDGFRFRGRGLIQITGREEYRLVGAVAGLPLEDKPELAADPEQALLVACAFWNWKKINPLCDAGDFTAVTIRINGGTTGLRDRLAWLDKVRRVLAEPPPADAQPLAADVLLVQRGLSARGFSEVGAADGVIGPRTAAAITRFRAINGLPPGLVDDQLVRLLEDA